MISESRPAGRPSVPRAGTVDTGAGAVAKVLCALPIDLPNSLERVMCSWGAEHGVQVLVERRRVDRRRQAERRADPWPTEASTDVAAPLARRQIRHSAGRRVAERRATLIPVGEPARLPRRAAGRRNQFVFLERIDFDPEHNEDIDAARLVTRYQAGERELFAELYTRYFDRVYGYLRVALHDRHEAEDATQQVFLQVMQALPSFELRGVPFRAWLFRVVRNHTLNCLGKLSRVEPAEPGELDQRALGAVDEPGALDWLTDTDLEILIGRLPLPQRQVLMLRYMMDLSWSQIAEVLDRSPDAVRQLQARALRQLRAHLTPIDRDAHRATRMPMARRRGLLPVLQARRRVLLAA